MTTQLITAPAALALSLENGRLAARRTDMALDDEIAIVINGLTKIVEHRIQRSIINRTWRETLDSFPDAIKLYYPPIVSISWIKYYDADNVLQTLDPADYTADTVSEPGYVVPAPDVTWPTTYDRINAVQVQYVAGYGATDASTPSDIKMYMMAKIAEHFGISKTSDFIEGLINDSGEKIWSHG